MRYYRNVAFRTKMVGKLLLIVFLTFCVLLTGFTEFLPDNLYHYQWGFRNNGNFVVNKGVLASNYIPIAFSKIDADNMFFDTKDAVDYLKAINTDPANSFAKVNFDIDFEHGYELFKSKEFRRDTIIAIIDTGIDINHYELKDSIWTNVNEIPNNDIDDDKNGYVDDVHGYNFFDRKADVFVSPTIDIHGTHEAGIIAAKHNNGGIMGLAYDSHIKIMPLKILGENGKGYMSSLVEAINYAKRNGANICNISLGAYTFDSSLDSIIKNNQDMLFVVAAGNGANYIGYSLDERQVYPANLEYDNVITVGNACFDGSRYISSNYGSHVDVFAPGTYILSTTPENGFSYLTGTSMAAPFVSALCSLLYCAYPKVPISQYKSLIIRGTIPTTELIGLCKGNGLINIYNTLSLAETF